MNIKISVVGAGYVGLVSGACFAEVGNVVCCVDNDAKKIAQLKQGSIPIHEPGLAAMVSDNMAKQRLSFTTSLAEAVAHGDILFIAVGTPRQEDGSADLQHVKRVAQAIGETIQDYRVIVTKSTVPVGTGEIIEQTIAAALGARKCRYSVLSNPEFLREGAAIEDFMKPDRIIVGSDDAQAVELLRTVYTPFNRNHDRIIVMQRRAAEMTKYAANAMLATRISFMNEMANLAERLGVDIEAVRTGIGSDPRIGYAFLYPGCGYGGSCFPKDLRALQQTAQAVDYTPRILNAVEAVNQEQKQVVLTKITEHFGEGLAGRTFALWGLAFKPDTDDMREAPSRTIIEGLWARQAAVKAFDPVATTQARAIYGERADLQLFSGSPYEVLDEVDGLIIATEWRVLRAVDFAQIKQKMRGNVIIDGRNMLSPPEIRAAGLVYYGIGRP